MTAVLTSAIDRPSRQVREPSRLEDLVGRAEFQPQELTDPSSRAKGMRMKTSALREHGVEPE